MEDNEKHREKAMLEKERVTELKPSRVSLRTSRDSNQISYGRVTALSPTRMSSTADQI